MIIAGTGHRFGKSLERKMDTYGKLKDLACACLEEHKPDKENMMQRDVSKLLRGFCKLTNKPFRAFKRAYDAMKPKEREETRVALRHFWEQNEAAGLLDHKKYYDLKKPLPKRKN